MVLILVYFVGRYPLVWDCGFPCILAVVLCFGLLCFSFAFGGFGRVLEWCCGWYYWWVVFCWFAVDWVAV